MKKLFCFLLLTAFMVVVAPGVSTANAPPGYEQIYITVDQPLLSHQVCVDAVQFNAVSYQIFAVTINMPGVFTWAVMEAYLQANEPLIINNYAASPEVTCRSGVNFNDSDDIYTTTTGTNNPYNGKTYTQTGYSMWNTAGMAA